MSPITLELSEYNTLMSEHHRLENELAALRAHNAIETARHVNERLNKIASHAIPIVKFAMAYLSPEQVHGWPRRDLDEFVALLEDRPRSNELDEISWVSDARAFVQECADWDARRDRRQVSLLGKGDRKTVAYMAHAVGKRPQRSANTTRALRWLRYLVEATPYAICAPWLPYVLILEEEIYRERSIADDLEIARRCDRIILCGGKLSEGMRREEELFKSLGKPVEDMLALGEEPPLLQHTKVM
jgi:hypothetical protein